MKNGSHSGGGGVNVFAMRPWCCALFGVWLAPPARELAGYARTGKQLKWIKHPDFPLKDESEKEPQLGLGLLDWPNGY